MKALFSNGRLFSSSITDKSPLFQASSISRLVIATLSARCDLEMKTEPLSISMSPHICADASSFPSSLLISSSLSICYDSSLNIKIRVVHLKINRFIHRLSPVTHLVIVRIFHTTEITIIENPTAFSTSISPEEEEI